MSAEKNQVREWSERFATDRQDLDDGQIRRIVEAFFHSFTSFPAADIDFFLDFDKDRDSTDAEKVFRYRMVEGEASLLFRRSYDDSELYKQQFAQFSSSLVHVLEGIYTEEERTSLLAVLHPRDESYIVTRLLGNTHPFVQKLSGRYLPSSLLQKEK